MSSTRKNTNWFQRKQNHTTTQFLCWILFNRFTDRIGMLGKHEHSLILSTMVSQKEKMLSRITSTTSNQQNMQKWSWNQGKRKLFSYSCRTCRDQIVGTSKLSWIPKHIIYSRRNIGGSSKKILIDEEDFTRTSHLKSRKQTLWE